jgi:hypothetical protein
MCEYLHGYIFMCEYFARVQCFVEVPEFSYFRFVVDVKFSDWVLMHSEHRILACGSKEGTFDWV